MGAALRYLLPMVLPNEPQQLPEGDYYDDNDYTRDEALITCKNEKGSVTVILGTRTTGKSELAYRVAEFFGRPTYAVSPEQKPPYPIERILLSQIDSVPKWSTVICDDLPAYASNRDYNTELAITLERIVPMVRHERCLHLIFVSQSAAQADKYILDCNLAFLKPLGLLMDDVERPYIKKIYREKVTPLFRGRSLMWTRQHAYMMSLIPSWEGLIFIKPVD